ncbi:GNAT family N-acetyltransferase, partial [Bacteroidota bacterium]
MKARKLCSDSTITICNLEFSQISQLSDLQPDGWYNVVEFFNYWFDKTYFHPIVVVDNEKVIGVANAFKNGKTAWLGNIIIHREYRKKGFGKNLTRAIMSLMKDMECSNQILTATNDGYPLYKKLGFKTSLLYNFYKCDKKIDFAPNNSIEHATTEDYNEIYKLDMEISGEDRKHILEEYISTAYIIKKGKNIQGFFMPEAGEGLIIADNNNIGIELLKYKLSSGLKKIVVPEGNPEIEKF